MLVYQWVYIYIPPWYIGIIPPSQISGWSPLRNPKWRRLATPGFAKRAAPRNGAVGGMEKCCWNGGEKDEFWDGEHPTKNWLEKLNVQLNWLDEWIVGWKNEHRTDWKPAGTFGVFEVWRLFSEKICPFQRSRGSSSVAHQSDWNHPIGSDMEGWN